MAKMYPDRLRPETRSNAERTLYEAFRVQLPNDYVVFHSVSWLARDAKSGARDGEADFIIAHPTQGILVIEVKGGMIRYEGIAHRWYSGSHEIKDPFEQVKGNMHNLLRKLKEMPFWQSRWLNLGYAIAFPDVKVDQSLRLDAPCEIILDRHALGAIEQWLENVMIYWRGQEKQSSTIGSAGIQSLIQLFCASWELRSPLALEFQQEEQEFIRLTEQQFGLLDFLTGHRRVAIGGCAGSGKTTLALEQSRRLAQQGFKVLLVCYNRNLAEYLRSDESRSSRVDVYNFHSLCAKLAQEAGLASEMNNDQHDSFWYDHKLPELLLKAGEILGARYDALIIDEGQDFHSDWWLPLLYLLRDPDQGVLYLFYDDNQNLFAGNKFQLPESLAAYTLPHNCRNTQEIHYTFMPFYRSLQTPKTSGPTGRQAKIAYYSNEHELQQLLRQELYTLTQKEKVYTDSIVILTPKARDKSQLWKLHQLGNLRITERWPPSENEVYISTIHSFKGLESPVVILSELQASNFQDIETLLYVGCSRARSYLIILADASLPDSIRIRLSSHNNQLR